MKKVLLRISRYRIGRILIHVLAMFLYKENLRSTMSGILREF